MTTQTIALPPPRANAPLLTRMMSDPLMGETQPIVWIIGGGHPYSPNGWQIKRMFIENGGVEVYAVSPEGNHGTRIFIPMARVRLIEEGMSIEVFVDQLEIAESDEDDEEEPEPEPGPVDTSSNEPAVS